MDQPSGRSFMQVLCEKYSPENFPYRRGPGMGVHVPATPQGSPMKGGLLGCPECLWGAGWDHLLDCSLLC